MEFLLALLIGSFVLQALLAETDFARVVGFTLFVLIFGGAIHAGRTAPWAARGAVALLLVALVLQVLNFLGVANLEGPLTVLALMIVLGALVATFADEESVPRDDDEPWRVVGRVVAPGAEGPCVTVDGVVPDARGWDHFAR